MSTTEPRKVVAIVGAGDAIGAAVGRRFAKGGYTVCLIRRSLEKAAPHVDAIVAAGGRAQAFSTDARDEGAVVALFEPSSAMSARSRPACSTPGPTSG